MIEHRRSNILSRSKAGRQPPASSKQSNDRISLSEVLFVKNGQLELKIPRGVLPDFLVEANDAVNRGNITEAIGLMSDENVEQACRKAEKDRRRADIIFLMLALIFQKTRQLKKAAKWYEKTLEHQQNPLVLNELGCIYQNTGRVTEAMEYLLSRSFRLCSKGTRAMCVLSALVSINTFYPLILDLRRFS